MSNKIDKFSCNISMPNAIRGIDIKNIAVNQRRTVARIGRTNTMLPKVKRPEDFPVFRRKTKHLRAMIDEIDTVTVNRRRRTNTEIRRDTSQHKFFTRFNLSRKLAMRRFVAPKDCTGCRVETLKDTAFIAAGSFTAADVNPTGKCLNRVQRQRYR